MTPVSRPVAGGHLFSIDGLVDKILGVDDIEGITVSGGEPFCQAGGLVSLIRRLRTHRDLGVIVYSGYRLKSLRRLAKQNPAVSGLLAQIDLLIDGPYIAERNDGAPLRGSANQGVIPLSGRYLPFLSSYGPNQPRNVELHLDIGERMLVGIPSSRQLAWWNSQKAE